MPVWNAVPAKSKGYSAWLKSISYSISYSIFGGNRSSTRFLPGKIVLLLDFFYSKNVIDLSLDFIVPLPDLATRNGLYFWRGRRSIARCLRVPWQHNLSASESVQVNISKAFFSLGSTGVFHGKLNPLSASRIFETCIIPILLYGCETWLLDSTCLQDLEKFQCEIGRRILGLSKFHSNTAVRVALHWPSMSTRTLLRKLSFLSKLICNNGDTMSSLQSVWTIYYSLSIVQQCRMLEAPLATDVVHQLLSDLPNAKSINKERDYDLLLVSVKAHPTAQCISQIASNTSWRNIWDNALDHGVKGTICQALLRELSQDRKCPLCGDQISYIFAVVIHL